MKKVLCLMMAFIMVLLAGCNNASNTASIAMSEKSESMAVIESRTMSATNNSNATTVKQSATEASDEIVVPTASTETILSSDLLEPTTETSPPFEGRIDYTENVYGIVENDTLYLYSTNGKIRNPIYFDSDFPYGAPDTVRKIVVSDGIHTLGYACLKGFRNIESIYIPASVESIEGEVFIDCDSLKEITVHPSNPKYKSVENNLFSRLGKQIIRYCPAQETIAYTIPETVTKISDDAFQGCKNLSTIVIGKNVELIGSRAFGDCDNLTSITVHPDNSYLMSENNVVFGKNRGDAYYPYTLVYYCLNNPDTVFIVPTVTRIANYAFFGCKYLTSITLPEGLDAIGEGAFSGCANLTEIVIPEGPGTIMPRTFNYCTNLKSITLPSSVTYIHDRVFVGCNNLSEVIIHEDNPNYKSDNGAIFDFDRKKLIFFLNRVITKYIIPDGVTSIGFEAFSNIDNLIEVELPESIEVIGQYAFYSCNNLSKVSMPEKWAGQIQRYAFADCSNLLNITIPDGTHGIGESAFAWCSSLASVTIPESVKTIEEESFWRCDSLIIHYKGSKAQWEAIEKYEGIEGIPVEFRK